MEQEQGYVYILTNPSFRDDWVKIGKSSRPVDVRASELDNTAVPLPFEIYATIKTSKYNIVERKMHKEIDRFTDLRIRQNREFFNVSPSVALDIMRDIGNLLDDAEICVYTDGKPNVSKSKEEDTELQRKQDAKNTKRKPPFRFHMVNLNIGDKIVFDKTGEEFVIASDDKIEYDGRLWSLSAYACNYNKSNNGGPWSYSYNGVKLTDLRCEYEK